MEGFGHDYGFTLEPEVESRQGPQSGVWTELEGLIMDPGADARGSYVRASERLVALSTDELAAALASQTHQAQRKKLINTALEQVTPQAVLALARAAGIAYKHPVSPVLDALLSELKDESVELPEAVRPRAANAFRSLVRHIVETWAATTVDTSATGYEHLFAEAAENTRTAAVAPEPERVVQLALETGAVGNVLWAAVAVLSEEEGIRKLLGMVKLAPAESRAAAMIAQQFANPQRLIMLLHEEEVDFDAVDALLKYMGGAAADPLLDVLVTANSRAVRRGILDRLIKLGPDICPAVTVRMKDDRWFVLRNMLHVLSESGWDVRSVDLNSYQNHSAPRVRREALQLLFKDPVARDRALANAFKDKDPHMIRAGMKAAARDEIGRASCRERVRVGEGGRW